MQLVDKLTTGGGGGGVPDRGRKDEQPLKVCCCCAVNQQDCTTFGSSVTAAPAPAESRTSDPSAESWLPPRKLPLGQLTALHPSGVAKSSTSFGWGKGGNVTSAGWQLTRYDPRWHMSSPSGVATYIGGHWGEGENARILWTSSMDGP